MEAKAARRKEVYIRIQTAKNGFLIDDGLVTSDRYIASSEEEVVRILDCLLEKNKENK